MGSAFGLGPVKDDDELLDRAGSRSSDSTSGVEGLFAAWTASIDADERRSARSVGPLGLRRVDGVDVSPDTLPEPRVVRVNRTRAVAVLGVLALTLSGGGVAAALTQPQLGGMFEVIQKARGVATVDMVAATTTEAEPAATTTSPEAEAQNIPEVLAEVEATIRAGDVEKAKVMIEVIRSVAPKGAAGAEITRKAEELEDRIADSPAVVADAPSRTTSSSSSSSSPWVKAEPSTASVATSTPTPTPTTGTDKATGTASPTDETTAPTATSTAPAATPDPTAVPTPTAVGTVGRDQVAGTGTPTAEASPSDKADPTPSEERTPTATSTSDTRTSTSSPSATRSASPTSKSSSATTKTKPKPTAPGSSAWTRTAPATSPTAEAGSFGG
ncbi:MAG: hypothetical protein Q4G43_13460 [Mobilicoccus sp.]|nr:hypothetical protein [Mobilicoccus sp.]